MVTNIPRSSLYREKVCSIKDFGPLVFNELNILCIWVCAVYRHETPPHLLAQSGWFPHSSDHRNKVYSHLHSLTESHLKMCRWDSQWDLRFPQDNMHQEDKLHPPLWKWDWGVVCLHPVHSSIQGHSFQKYYLEMIQLLILHRTFQQDRACIHLHERGPAKSMTRSVNSGKD